MIFSRLVQGAGEVAWLVHCVRIGKKQPLPAGCLRRRPAGISFACEPSAVAEIQSGSGQDSNSEVVTGRLLGDLAGVVGRVVVNYDEFPLLAKGEAGLGLSDERFQAGAEGSCFVSGWNDDREPDLCRTHG